jgi:hypothetical protein
MSGSRQGGWAGMTPWLAIAAAGGLACGGAAGAEATGLLRVCACCIYASRSDR